MCKTSDTATNKGKPTQVPRQDVGAPPAGAGELAVERGGDMADGEVFTAATGQELVVSTGILGDLALPAGACDPDRTDEIRELAALCLIFAERSSSPRSCRAS